MTSLHLNWFNSLQMIHFFHLMMLNQFLIWKEKNRKSLVFFFLKVFRFFAAYVLYMYMYITISDVNNFSYIKVLRSDIVIFRVFTSNKLLIILFCVNSEFEDNFLKYKEDTFQESIKQIFHSYENVEISYKLIIKVNLTFNTSTEKKTRMFKP